jgi:hypothetical protein
MDDEISDKFPMSCRLLWNLVVDNRATGEAPRRAHPFGTTGRPCHGEKDKEKNPYL